MHCIDLLPQYMYLKIYFSLYNDIYNIYVIIHHCAGKGKQWKESPGMDELFVH